MEGVRQVSIEMARLGSHSEAVTLDPPAATFVAEFPIEVHALGPSSSGYLFNGDLVPWLRRNAGRFDAAIVHGLWQYHSFGAWRGLAGSGLPYYVYPHGMLDPWFKAEYPLKHLKKWLYWPWAEYRVLRDARRVLFTTEEERVRARRSFWLYRAREKVVAFGAARPPADGPALAARFLAARPELRDKQLILFLGRVHPKKGCDLLIEAFAAAAPADPSLHLLVAGPGEEPLLSRLRDRAQRLGVAARITWLGMVQGVDKWGAFHASSAFVLPSHQENFGVAVAEALGCGVPVLISDKVNIAADIAADGAGLVEPDTLAGTHRLFERWASLGREGRALMAQRARETYESRYSVQAMAAQLLETLAGD